MPSTGLHDVIEYRWAQKRSLSCCALLQCIHVEPLTMPMSQLLQVQGLATCSDTEDASNAKKYASLHCKHMGQSAVTLIACHVG